jgi:hypothetical protein
MDNGEDRNGKITKAKSKVAIDARDINKIMQAILLVKVESTVTPANLILRLDSNDGTQRIKTINFKGEKNIVQNDMQTYLRMLTGPNNDVYFVHKNKQSKKYLIMCMTQRTNTQVIVNQVFEEDDMILNI